MLYQQVYDDLRKKIRSGEYPVGERLPAEAELTEHYEVSAITIRRALDMLRTDGFVVRRPRVGTSVISANPLALASDSTSPRIAMVVTTFDDTFGSLILEGALDAAHSKAELLLDRSQGSLEREEEAIESLVEGGAQALVLLPTSSGFVPPAVLSLIAREFPVVILDRYFDGLPITTIKSDNTAAATTATQELFELGHRRVAMITSHGSVTSNDERRGGWVIAHALNNVPLDDDLFFNEIRSTQPGSKVSHDDDVDRLVKFVEAHPDVTAFLAGEYNLALLLRDALSRLELRIPQDVSVICFDHPTAPFDRQAFRFTHVAQDQEQLGRCAIESALEQISSGATAEKIDVPTSLIRGWSSAPVRDVP